MKTVQSELDSFDADLAALKAKQDTERNALSVLPPDMLFSQVCVHSESVGLYFNYTDLHLRSGSYTRERDGLPPIVVPDPRTEIDRLAALLRPVGRALSRDGCVGSPALRERPFRTSAEIEYIDPFTLRYQPHTGYGSAEVIVEWPSNLGGIPFDVRISFDLWPLREVFGELTCDVKRYPDGEVKSAMNLRLRAPFQIEKHIRYAGGSHKDPGSIFLYWPCSPDVDTDEKAEAWAAASATVESPFTARLEPHHADCPMST